MYTSYTYTTIDFFFITEIHYLFVRGTNYQLQEHAMQQETDL